MLIYMTLKDEPRSSAPPSSLLSPWSLDMYDTKHFPSSPFCSQPHLPLSLRISKD